MSHFVRELNKIFALLLSSEKRAELYNEAIAVATYLTHSERATIFLAPQFTKSPLKNGTLHSLVALGMGQKSIEVDSDKGIAGYVFRTREPVIAQEAHKNSYFNSKIDQATGFKTLSVLAVPIVGVTGTMYGVLELMNKKNAPYSNEDQELALLIAYLVGIGLEGQERLLSAENQVEAFKSAPKSSSTASPFEKSANKDMQQILAKLPAYAKSESAVFIRGESGTGKEVIAQRIHELSPRSGHAFIAVNCAALPESLFEAELFGVAKGAATGTIARKGKFELAHHGTIFLDEVGELTPAQQAKLLRVLQDGCVSRVGSDQEPVALDFRLITATNRNLEDMVAKGTFREDLYYRLNVVAIHLPPLRERTSDIAGISESILSSLVKGKSGFRSKKLSAEALEKLCSYSWPGNIRQLRNRLEHALIVSGERDELLAADLGLEAAESSYTQAETANGAVVIPITNKLKLRDFKDRAQAQLLAELLKDPKMTKTKIAQRLGISREGLRKILRKKAA